jgi:hypothetical protein
MRSKPRSEKLLISSVRKSRQLTSWETKCWRRSVTCVRICFHSKSSNSRQLQDWPCCKITSLPLNCNSSPNSRKSWFSRMNTWQKKWPTSKKTFKFTNKFSRNWPSDPTTREALSRNSRAKSANLKNRFRLSSNCQVERTSTWSLKDKRHHKWKKPTSKTQFSKSIANSKW